VTEAAAKLALVRSGFDEEQAACGVQVIERLYPTDPSLGRYAFPDVVSACGFPRG